MYRRIGAIAAAGAAAVAVAAPSTAAAATKVVFAGGPPKYQSGLIKKYAAGVDNFLINRVTINAGDTVVWDGKSLAGGFHTVDIPKLGGSDLPLFLPGKTVTGVNDFAGNPFWFNGRVPALGFNPVLFKPIGRGSYNGSSRVDSGLPLGPKPVDFKVQFTKPGVYKYFCDVHHGMVGYVVVKPRGTRVPSARDDRQALLAQEVAYTATAKRLDRTKVTGNKVSLGASGPGGIEVFAMFPSTLRVSTGTTVKFSMSKLTREVHTASFGPAAYLKPLADSLGSPAPSPIALYPSDPPGSIQLNQSSHGNGFANTGGLDRDSDTPFLPSGTIKFTQPGTYHFQCLIHPFMHGTVIVR